MGEEFAAAHAQRISVLNKKPPNPHGNYVLYWVQASPRISFNHALELAAEKANKAGKPVAAVFSLGKGFHRLATRRSYAFLLQGLVELSKGLKEERGIPLYVYVNGKEGPAGPVVELGQDAVEVVVDMGYLRIQRQWYDQVAAKLPCRFTQVETNVVVPVTLASNKEEFAARTIRPRIWKHAPSLLKSFEPVQLEVLTPFRSLPALLGCRMGEKAEGDGGVDYDVAVLPENG